MPVPASLFFHSSFAHQAFSPTIRSNSSPVIVSWASRYSATAVSTSRRAVKISSQRAYARSMMALTSSSISAAVFFRVAARLAHRLADEHLVVPALKGDGAELLAHAVGRDHLARDVRGALDVVRRAGGNVAEHQLLRRAPAEERDDLLLHVALGLVGAVLVGQRNGQPPACPRGTMVMRWTGSCVGRRASRRHGSPRDRAVSFRSCSGTTRLRFLGSGEDLDLRLLKVRHGDELVAAASAQQRRLVGKVLKVRAGKPAVPRATWQGPRPRQAACWRCGSSKRPRGLMSG